MRVLFDHQIFQAQVTGGISKSFCEYIPFLEGNGVDWAVSIKQSNNIYLGQILPSTAYSPILRDYRNVPAIFSSKRLGAYWFTLLDRLRICRTAESLNKSNTFKLLKKGEFDVFHPTFFSPYFIDNLKGKPFVLTVHDLIPERFPSFFKSDDIQITGRKALLHRADAIVAVSNNTKNDLIRYYGIPSERIKVIYHGAPVPERTVGERMIDNPYFLFVGGRGGYKNFDCFLQAFSAFSLKYPEVRIVCTGASFSPAEEKRLASLGLQQKIISMHVEENDFQRLYYHAIALVYPSQYEGFGMPILEAFSFRCPVLTSPWSSLPEVGGDAAIYLEKDFSDFEERLTQLYLLSNDKRDMIIKRGEERAAQFLWKNTAREYADVYRLICSK